MRTVDGHDPSRSAHPQPSNRAAARRLAAKRRRTRALAWSVAGALLLAGLLAGLAALADRQQPRADREPAQAGAGLMGGQLIATPGTRSGSATAGAVRVDGAVVAMGHVPLANAVKPTWQLRNTGNQPVTLGEPKVAVVRGCCPGPLTLGAHAILPGGQTTLAFPLRMHPGMDGPHEFRITVPVAGTAQPLQLTVTGDFR